MLLSQDCGLDCGSELDEHVSFIILYTDGVVAETVSIATFFHPHFRAVAVLAGPL
jgi:hypothetical protein